MARTRKKPPGDGDGTTLAEILADPFPEPTPAPTPLYRKYIDAAAPLSGWKPAAEVLDKVTAIRTVFPDFNRAIRVGGLPVRRIHTVHGPTHGGKTAFILGLVKSFVDVGYPAGYIDAEHALDFGFADQIVGEIHNKPNFLADRPSTYEGTIGGVNKFLDWVRKLRETHAEMKSLLIVDSINKLVPERELTKLLKAGPEELAKGHQGRYRAALNQAWLDSLTPKVAAAECAMVIIAQEREEEDPKSFFDTFKVKGGAALLFDASIVCRVMKASPVYANPSADEKKNEDIVGFSHRVRIWKSKVGHMDGRHSDSIFHLSNGKLTPPGLDTGRDAFEIAKKLGIVQATSGGWYSWDGRRIQGQNKVIKWLYDNPPHLTALLDSIASRLDTDEGRSGTEPESEDTGPF